MEVNERYKKGGKCGIGRMSDDGRGERKIAPTERNKRKKG